MARPVPSSRPVGIQDGIDNRISQRSVDHQSDFRANPGKSSRTKERYLAFTLRRSLRSCCQSLLKGQQGAAVIVPQRTDAQPKGGMLSPQVLEQERQQYQILHLQSSQAAQDKLRLFRKSTLELALFVRGCLLIQRVPEGPLAGYAAD